MVSKMVGRREIFTDEPFVTSENIIPIMQKAMKVFPEIAKECTFLLEYEGGDQPLKREKKYREDINIIVNDNIANEVTEFKLGFNWGCPITLVQRGEKDSGGENETKAISLLNECYSTEKYESKTQQLARFVEITGIGYTFVDVNTEYVDGDSFFTLNVLDPRCAFVIKSSYYVDRRVMLGCSFRTDEDNNYYFTCFSKDARYELAFKSGTEIGKYISHIHREDDERWSVKVLRNIYGVIPIVEWFRSYDRTGCFERQIAEMDALNISISDFFNDVDQNTQAIFHGNDLEFPKDENGEEIRPKTNDWFITSTTADGKTPFVKPISVNYDYQGMLAQIAYRTNRIKEKCNVPQRSEASNATGIAVSDSSGWTSAEAEAEKQDLIKDGCKTEEVRAVLSVIKKSPYIPSDSPLLSLRYSDVKSSFKRQKNYEMSVKTSALANMLSHGIHGLHALNAIGLFDDNAQVWADSEEMIRKYQNSLFEKSGTQESGNVQTTDGGMEAQIQNSRRIDGMKKEKPESKEE